MSSSNTIPHTQTSSKFFVANGSSPSLVVWRLIWLLPLVTAYTSPSVMFLSPPPRGSLIATRERNHVIALPPLDTTTTTTTTTTTVHSRTRTLGFVVPPTQVDTELWKHARPWNMDNQDQQQQQQQHRHNKDDDDNHGHEKDAFVISSFLPWIPTREQIESLTRTQLRYALAERGLLQGDTRSTDNHRNNNSNSSNRNKSSPKEQPPPASHANLSELREQFLKWAHDQQSLTYPSASVEIPSFATLDKVDVPSSLAEWARNVNLEPILQRRKDIWDEKKQGKKTKKFNQERTPISRSSLSNLFQKDSKYSNYQIQHLYAAAKKADQQGDTEAAKDILYELLKTMPHDARIFRRLARLEAQQNHHEHAQRLLQEGIRLHPNNGHLWHALGNLLQDKRCYHKAIQVDPSFPFSYHTLGTLEHSQGHIAEAMKILTRGVHHCPQNHRLHHALGDLYRDAKMLDMAQKSYSKASVLAPEVSRGFAWTGLAHVAYEQGKVEACRRLLRKSIELNHGRFSNGWKALAQMEEAQGNVDAARAACMAGLAQYEQGLWNKHTNVTLDATQVFLQDVDTLKIKLLASKVPRYRSGDRFFALYRNWLRLEERYGTQESVEVVYERAASIFPDDWKLALDMVDYYTGLNKLDQARIMLVSACTKAGVNHAEPYQRYASMEMSAGNYEIARRILFRGASLLSSASRAGGNDGVVELLITWAVCEWHLKDWTRATTLLDRALRWIPAGEYGAALRVTVCYVMARVWYDQGEYLLAQHSIALCLHEHKARLLFGDGSHAPVWQLWSRMARAMGNDRLASECHYQTKHWQGRNPVDRVVSVEDHLRRDPWHDELFPDQRPRLLLDCLGLPEEEEVRSAPW